MSLNVFSLCTRCLRVRACVHIRHTHTCTPGASARALGPAARGDRAAPPAGRSAPPRACPPQDSPAHTVTSRTPDDFLQSAQRRQRCRWNSGETRGGRGWSQPGPAPARPPQTPLWDSPAPGPSVQVKATREDRARLPQCPSRATSAGLHLAQGTVRARPWGVATGAAPPRIRPGGLGAWLGRAPPTTLSLPSIC